MVRKREVREDQNVLVAPSGLAEDHRATATYTFSDGTTVTIRAVGAPVIYNLQAEHDKPQPTKKKVIKVAGGATRVPDITDPEYVQAVRDWEIVRLVQFSRTLILEGVADDPPDDVIDYWNAAGYTNPLDIKYMWIGSKLYKVDLANEFYAAIMGLTMPTDEGIEQAEAAFPGAVQTRQFMAPDESMEVEEEPEQDEGGV